MANMDFDPAHYNLPNLPVALWPLPPPCHARLMQQPHLGRFRKLLEHIVLSNLRRRGCNFAVHEISFDTNNSKCRFRTKCYISMLFDLPEGFSVEEDSKRAAFDIVRYAPQEVQKVEVKTITSPLTETEPLKPYLKAIYIPNCKDNEAGHGLAPLLHFQDYPTVNINIT